MMPLLVLLMAVSFWATQLYEAKITAMKTVRGAVFTQATFGCGAPGATSFNAPTTADTSSLENADGAEPVGTVDGASLEVVARKLPNAPGGDVLDRAVGFRAARVVRPVVVNGLVGVTTRVSGSSTMTCNESVRDGDPKAVKQVAGNAFDPRSP